MNCVNHSSRTGYNTCSKCGAWLCDECSVDIDGQYICKNCIAELSNGKTRHHHTHIHHDRPEHGKRRVSWGLLFIFSFILPGINYMYMGLVKRGLFTLTSFFLFAYLAGTLDAPIFGIVIPIIWVTSIFDGFNIRRRINSGEFVPDGVEDIKSSLLENKTPILCVIAIVIGATVLSNFMFHARALTPILSALAIGFGIYFLFNNRKPSCKRRDDSNDQE